MTADPTMIAALSQDGAWMFCAMKVELPGKTLRLLDGSGIMTIGGEVYVGEDPDFGVLAAVDDIEENDGDEAPEIHFRLYPKNETALATLASAAMQLSKVILMHGALNPATMTPIGTPEIDFLGEIDVATLRLGAGMREVEYSAVSIFDLFFEIDEGQRATDGFHQSIWPGELGLDQMTGTTEKLYLGATPPAGSSATYGGASIPSDGWARYTRGQIVYG